MQDLAWARRSHVTACHTHMTDHMYGMSQAGLCEVEGDLEAAERLYRANLARLERDVGGAMPGVMQALIACMPS